MADEEKGEEGGCSSDIVHQKVFVCDEEEEEFKWNLNSPLIRFFFTDSRLGSSIGYNNNLTIYKNLINNYILKDKMSILKYVH